MELSQIASHDMDIQRVLEYKNENVINHFMSSYEIDYCESEIIFTEMPRWLWLNGQIKEQSNVQIGIDEPLLVIDEMWHTFILHTYDYSLFCKEYFGHYLHHTPTPKAEIGSTQNPKLGILQA